MKSDGSAHSVLAAPEYGRTPIPLSPFLANPLRQTLNSTGVTPFLRLIITAKRMSAKQATESGSNMTKDFRVYNKLGIHARPAAMFVKLANRFNCDIFVENDAERFNAKTTIALIMLPAGPGL